MPQLHLQPTILPAKGSQLQRAKLRRKKKKGADASDSSDDSATADDEEPEPSSGKTVPDVE
jgi:hypothetical protein